MAKKGRILTGDRPTGRAHLGHYVGSFANRVRLQDDYEIFLLVADYHALTTHPNREAVQALRDQAREIVKGNLAVGVDPEKVTIYRQSDVPTVAELTLLFTMLVTVARVERMPTLKEKIADTGIENPSLGLLSYPVLQAADILHVKADLVPVGKDQESHIEVTREIARRFNTTYGEVFPEPQALIGEVGTLLGTDGKAKMSKSLDNAIYLSDDAETVRRKVMTMYTDPKRVHAHIPGTVEGNPVFQYHDAFNPDTAEIEDLKERYRTGRVGDVEVKKKLIKALDTFLGPMRERYAHYDAHPGLVDDILAAGADKVRPISKETLDQAREAMGIGALR
jgi:tryptophanyl-tRNA synthetase